MRKYKDIDYELIRSDRRSIAIEIDREYHIKVRAPRRALISDIEKLLEEKYSWIIKHMAKIESENSKRASLDYFTEAELREMGELALKIIPEKCAYYARILGVTYGGITIRCQKTRWGSCSSKGNLNFNCLLMKAPEKCIDYVVIHELCHRLEMNHSRVFWAHVARVMPDYKTYERWLKENGHILMSRVRR